MIILKLFSIFLIFIITLLSGIYPFIKKIYKKENKLEFPAGEALSSGIFLGISLLHMLNNGEKNFLNHGYNYPVAPLISGIVFLLLLFFEHIGKEIYHRKGDKSISFTILSLLLLSVHSFLSGIALGFSDSITIILIILFAIIAHKSLVSFALAIQINKSNLTFFKSFLLFAIFCLMLPLGAFIGSIINIHISQYIFFGGIFNSLSSGTFLYLGTLHGLNKAVMIEKCCDLQHFIYMLIGFFIMSFIAIWT